ncbi:MAG: N-acetyltransferase, partial [Alphaproteobacteria bacterium]
MKAPPLPLTSARLIYRLNQLDDLEFLLDIHSRPDVVRFLPWGVLDEASLRAKINERMQEKTLIEDGDKLNFICLDKESGVRVGEVGLFMRSKDHQGGEVGYVMHP